MNKIIKNISIVAISLLGSASAAFAVLTSQGTATTPVTVTLSQPAASITVLTAPVGFSGTLALPASGSGLINYYSTQTGGDSDTGVGTVAWNATIGSTWQVNVYTSNTSGNGGLQSTIASDQFLPLKYTTESRGNINTDVTDGVAYADGNIYSFIPDVSAPRTFAQSGVEADIVTGLDFRFATALDENEVGGTYNGVVTFELLIDII